MQYDKQKTINNSIKMFDERIQQLQNAKQYCKSYGYTEHYMLLNPDTLFGYKLVNNNNNLQSCLLETATMFTKDQAKVFSLDVDGIVLPIIDAYDFVIGKYYDSIRYLKSIDND